MIETVILDIGMVLANFRWRDYIKELNFDEEITHQLEQATILSSHWREQDRNLSLSECERLMCQDNKALTKQLQRFFETIWDIVKEYDYSVDFIRALKKEGYGVYLLSNYGRELFEYGKERFHFIQEADGGVISYEVNSIKPEPKIYECLFEKYAIDPKKSVFLDDSERNLEGAKKFGIKTIQFTSLKDAILQLRELGVCVHGLEHYYEG